MSGIAVVIIMCVGIWIGASAERLRHETERETEASERRLKEMEEKAERIRQAHRTSW